MVYTRASISHISYFICRKPLELFPNDFWTSTGGSRETGGAKEDNMGNTNPAATATNKEDVMDNNNPGKPIANEDASCFKSLREGGNGTGPESHKN